MSYGWLGQGHFVCSHCAATAFADCFLAETSTCFEMYITIYLFLGCQMHIQSSNSHLRSRYTSGRSVFCPLGDESRKFVAEGNRLASRLILMLYVCVSQGCIFLLEQPEGSIFSSHPRWQEFLEIVQVIRL